MVPRIHVSELLEKCIEWPTKMCGIDLRFARNEDWMHVIPPGRITARSSQQRSVLGSCFGRYNFRIDLFDLPTTDSYLSSYTHLSDTRPVLVAR